MFPADGGCLHLPSVARGSCRDGSQEGLPWWAEGQQEPCAGAQSSYLGAVPSSRMTFPHLSASFPFQAALTEPIWSEETFAELLGSGELESSVTGAGGAGAGGSAQADVMEGDSTCRESFCHLLR